MPDQTAINASRQITEDLFAAVIQGDIPAAQKAIDQGAKANAATKQYRTPLIVAISANQPEMMSFLFSRGASANLPDPDSKLPPLAFAISEGSGVERCALLLRAGADPLWSPDGWPGDGKTLPEFAKELGAKPDTVALLERARSAALAPEAQRSDSAMAAAMDKIATDALATQPIGQANIAAKLRSARAEAAAPDTPKSQAKSAVGPQ